MAEPNPTAPLSARPREGQGRFVSLRHRDFLLMWSGQLISQAGTQMEAVAISWQVYQLTHSPVALGLIGLTRAFPVILFSLAGGVYADAYDRRLVLFVTQSAMMLFAAALGFLTNIGEISAGAIYLLSVLTATSIAFDVFTWQAIVANLVSKEHLSNVLSLNSIMR